MDPTEGTEDRTLSNRETTGSDVGLDDVERAEEITVSEPGSNMLWVQIDWGDEQQMFDVKATPENKMLFDKDTFTFDGMSLYTLLFGDEYSRATLLEEPFVAVKPGPYVDTYRVWVDSEVKSVLTPTSKSQEVLQAVVDVIEHESEKTIRDLYDTVREEQVNRDAMIALLEGGHFDSDRISVEADGFVVDDYFLLTWEGKFFIYTETWEDGAFTPRGDSKEKPGQFRTINVNKDALPDQKGVDINGVRYTMDKDDALFIRRLKWIMNWRENMDEAEVSSIERTVPILQEHNI